MKHTYIGATTDINRRLRQHNQEIKGGAKSTRMYNNWKRVCFISGFMDQKSALQFEWKWKHNSRYKRKIEDKLNIMKDLLNGQMDLIVIYN
jgi:structure-specific endonuclease subunit SLX1